MMLYAISDRRLHPDADLIAQCSALIRSGVDWLQVREKDIPDGVLLGVLKVLVPEARRFGVNLLVNGRADLALLSGASGVHLPSSGVPTGEARSFLPPTALVVRSCHNAEELSEAREGNADAVTLGPVFETPSKRNMGHPMGLESFSSLKGTCPRMKVIALGGVDSVERARMVLRAGADGIAAIRLFCTMKNPMEEVPELRRILMESTLAHHKENV